MPSAPASPSSCRRFQNADYIRATMDSVLAQTYTDFEVVVADHSSTDGTWDAAAAVRGRPARPPARARLRAAAPSATGTGSARRRAASWSSWSAATTCSRREPLAAQVAELDRHDDGVVMVASARDIVDATGRAVVRKRRAGWAARAGARSARRSVVRWSVAPTSSASRAACWSVVRRWRRWAAGTGTPAIMIDQATYCRVLLRGDLATVPDRWPPSGSAAGQ